MEKGILKNNVIKNSVIKNSVIKNSVLKFCKETLLTRTATTAIRYTDLVVVKTLVKYLSGIMIKSSSSIATNIISPEQGAYLKIDAYIN
jgi:hypothetical protein